MAEGITLKRIIDMDEAAELTSSDYALVDSATGGPKKFALGNELSSLKEDLNYGLKTNILPLSLGTTIRNGVTLTKNSDGTYTANGTATAQANFKIGEISAISGDFMITGCPSGGGGSTYSIEVQENGTWKYSEKGSGKQISVTEKTLAVYVVIKSGYSANSVIFKPQITADLNATYNDFYPSGIYAKTYFDLLKNSYLFGGVIPVNTDLNDVKAQGIYNISRNLTYSNFPYPVGTPAILHVYYMSATTVYQIIYNIDDGNVLTRKYTSGTWSSWSGIANFNSLYFYKGVVENNTDLNNVTEQGIYNLSRNLVYTNFPFATGNACILHVYYLSATTVYQIIYNMDTGKMLTRKYVSGTWGAWQNEFEDYGYNTNVVCISHRGTRTTRPDSTSSAYINARKCGFRYAEGDLQRTSDGHYVIGHEDDIYDRTGIHQLISESTLASLKSIDFGQYLFPAYAGQAILTLEEFLGLCNNLGMTPVLDFKSKTEAQVAEIMAIIKNYGLPVYNINGTLQTLKYVLAINPDQFIRRSYDSYNSSIETEITSLFADYPNAHFMIACGSTYGTGWTDAILEDFASRGIEVCLGEINSSSQFEQYCSGKYYVHHMMVGSQFDPAEYALKRDNNILVNS